MADTELLRQIHERIMAVDAKCDSIVNKLDGKADKDAFEEVEKTVRGHSMRIATFGAASGAVVSVVLIGLKYLLDVVSG
jgi:hypothetical protein